MLLVKSVEGVEEFLLRGILSGDKLNIVDQKNVAAAVFFVEFIHFVPGKALDHLVGEFIALDINYVDIRFFSPDLVDNGVHQVGLSQSARSVYEQRVVIHCRSCRNGGAGGVCEFIGVSDDEVVKGVLEIVRRQGLWLFWLGPLLFRYDLVDLDLAGNAHEDQSYLDIESEKF